jgi:hypothetical protein
MIPRHVVWNNCCDPLTFLHVKSSLERRNAIYIKRLYNLVFVEKIQLCPCDILNPGMITPRNIY